MPKVTLWADAGRICFRLAYDSYDDIADFLADFKAMVPGKQRQWNPKKDKKTGRPAGRGDNSWDFDATYLDRVRTLASQQGFEVEVVGAEEPKAAAPDEQDAFRQMFSSVSTENLRKLYLALAKAYHPDRAPVGSEDGDSYQKVMESINAGWARVQDERSPERPF